MKHITPKQSDSALTNWIDLLGPIDGENFPVLMMQAVKTTHPPTTQHPDKPLKVYHARFEQAHPHLSPKEKLKLFREGQQPIRREPKPLVTRANGRSNVHRTLDL